MSESMTDRVAVITGGAAGIGLATARALVGEGAAVALLDVDEGRAESAAGALSSGGHKAIGVGADVTDEAAVSRAVARVRESLGPIDALMNNAGIAAIGRLHETDGETWERVMAVNVTGTYRVSRAVLPEMLERGLGTIVNVGSVAGLVGIPQMAAYCAAKGAIINLTRQMAADYSGRGVRVNCICPGTIATTDMGRSLLGSDTSAEAQARRLAKYPLGRFGEPDEVAAVALFLLSDASAFVTGAAYRVDGGMTAI